MARRKTFDEDYVDDEIEPSPWLTVINKAFANSDKLWKMVDQYKTELDKARTEIQELKTRQLELIAKLNDAERRIDSLKKV